MGVVLQKRVDEVFRPRFVVPAAPKLALTPPSGREWQHEVKFDGWRVQVHASGGAVCLLSRNGNDLSKRFSRMVSGLAGFARFEGVIDGELVAVDEQGHCDFAALQRGDKTRLCLRAFDLLALNGLDFKPMPLMVRRVRLRRLVERCGPPLLYSEAFDDPAGLMKGVMERGLEGIVSKRSHEPYRPGNKSGWVKVKTEAWHVANAERWKFLSRG